MKIVVNGEVVKELIEGAGVDLGLDEMRGGMELKIEIVGDCGDFRLNIGNVNLKGSCQNIDITTGSVTVEGNVEGNVNVQTGNVKLNSGEPKGEVKVKCGRIN